MPRGRRRELAGREGVHNKIEKKLRNPEGDYQKNIGIGEGRGKECQNIFGVLS